MKSPTPTLIKAMRQLSIDIQSEDQIANMVISEAADRLEEQEERINRLEDAGDAMASLLDGIGEADTWRESKETKP
jgi:hypothetical protein